MQSVTRAIGIGYLLICLLALLATAFVGPVGDAPFPLPIGPACLSSLLAQIKCKCKTFPPQSPRHKPACKV